MKRPHYWLNIFAIFIIALGNASIVYGVVKFGDAKDTLPGFPASLCFIFSGVGMIGMGLFLMTFVNSYKAQLRIVELLEQSKS